MQTQHKQLHTLADIRTGYTFRDRIAVDPEGDVAFVQIKDIKGRTEVPEAELPRMRWPGNGAPPVLGKGDIVLPSRGEYYEAAIANVTAPVVATSQLFVLSAKSKTVTPEFLCWYINQPEAQNYFRASRMGSNIPMLNKQTLGMLTIPVPSLEVQRKIVALQALQQRERELTFRLMQNREQMLAALSRKLLEQ